MEIWREIADHITRFFHRTTDQPMSTQDTTSEPRTQDLERINKLEAQTKRLVRMCALASQYIRNTMGGDLNLADDLEHAAKGEWDEMDPDLLAELDKIDVSRVSAEGSSDE